MGAPNKAVVAGAGHEKVEGNTVVTVKFVALR
jgi:hypothetical protein